MEEPAPEATDPPLTRKELRHREEAACADQEAPQIHRQEPPPPAPVQPAAVSPAPRSSPSGRVPQWAIDEAAGKPPQDTAWRSAPEPVRYDWESTRPGSTHQAYVPPAVRYPSPIKRFFRALGRTLADIFNGLWGLAKFVLVTGLLIVAVWNVLAHMAPSFTADAGRMLASYGITAPFIERYTGIKPPSTVATGGASPPPGVESSDKPLGAPEPAKASSHSYAFLRAGTDQPFVSYDPCRPIHYVVRPDNAPAGGDQMIAEAVAAASKATGFVFVNDGVTSESPSLERPAYQLDRYGNRWAPVLFAWETWDDEPQFTENWLPGSTTTLGLGGSTAVTVDDANSAYVTGQVRLNAAALGTMAKRPGGTATVTAVVKHELAHVLGLDHIGDPTQLMAAKMSGNITEYAAGDLAGLAILGTGKCRPAV
jgi:hypothetical protein